MAKSTLPAHVEALRSPEAYANAPGDVRLIQTHISYVFIGDDEVYKLKKPVNLGFVDFSTLAKRKADCEAEVRLNRRGCSGDTYIGVEKVTRGPDGRFVMGGEGKVIDYAVHMKRLPDDRMMDHLLERDAVDFGMIGRLVARVTTLHEAAERGPKVTRTGGRLTLAKNWRETLDSMRGYVGATLGLRRFERIEAYVEAFLAAEEPLLRRRETEGWIRDCHGDMRSDAVCFDERVPEGICIYDCIEFNDSLRYGDTALDVAFLAMDLDYRDRSDLSDLFIGLYTPAIGDIELPLLLNFYKAYRACVRGKVETLLALDDGVEPAKRRQARQRAKAYFRLAESYARKRTRRGLNLVSGPSGSGKSVLAGALASRTGAALLSTDMLRQRSAPEPGRGAPIDAGKYSEEARNAVYDEMLARARTLLEAKRPVVLDGTFIEKAQRAPFIALARELKQPLLVVECSAPDDVIRERQKRREGEAWSRSEGRWDVYLAQKQRIEPADEVAVSERVAVDTTMPLEEQLAKVIGRQPKAKTRRRSGARRA